MRLSILLFLQVLLILPLTSLAAGPGKSPVTQDYNKAGVLRSYGNMPLSFIQNNGQAAGSVRFYERGAGHVTFFTDNGLVLALTKNNGKVDKASHTKAFNIKAAEKVKTEAVRLSFVGANDKVKITAYDKMPGHVNYFVGNDKTKWRKNIPTFGALTYEDVYKNIDIRFYGNNKNIEHDVIVRPGGDLSMVRFAYEGVKGLKVNEAGELEVSLNYGKLIEQRPVIYQDINGQRVAVEGSYSALEEKDGSFSYGFKVASYDRTKDLVIDPVLVYSTYFGGAALDFGWDIAVDNTGAAYVTGQTASADFPTVAPIQGVLGGGAEDAFVSKINAAGTAIIYSTYIGGGLSDVGRGISVDGTGAVYITGQTASIDFPTVTPVQAANAGGVSDAFIMKIDSTGTAIVYSTYLGGIDDDWGTGIALDGTGAAYVTGTTLSADFPLASPIQGVFGGSWDAFVTKIDSAGSVFTYSTYLGGSGSDFGQDIAADSSGAAYITGQTASLDFPLVAPIQGTNGGGIDAFITRVDPAGAAYTYSTYLGGLTDDIGFSIAIDSLGSVYVTGNTDSADFPLVNPMQGAFGGGLKDAFVSKINSTGTAVIYSTYLGGSASDFGDGIAVDATGSAYVIGDTFSADFPLLSPIQGAFGGGLEDVFVTKINPVGSAKLYSTFIGGNGDDLGFGIAIGIDGESYVTGYSDSTNFPLMSPIQGTLGGGAGFPDAFISKVSGAPLPVVALLVSPDDTSVAEGSILGYTVMATNTTAVTQCFNYWENVTLPNSSVFPANGTIFGPVRLCLNGGTSQSVHMSRGVPLAAPMGAYVFNSFVGAYINPAFPIVVDEAHLNFNVTPPVVAPAQNPQTSWRLLENGFRK